MKKFYSFIAMMLLSALSFTANAATATVYIDKQNAVSFYVFDGDYNRIELANIGDTPNFITFDETKTKFFEFDPYNLNTGIYKITKNDVEIDLSATFNGEGYEVYDVKDGDVIRVQVDRPANVFCTFTFEKGAEAIASVENADADEVFYEVENNTFKTKPGDRVVLRPNPDYTITSATLNGEELQFIPVSGCYFFVAKDETNVILIEATEIATAIKNLNANAGNSKIYNLQGVEMNRMNQPGLYIVNGKKIMVK